MCLSLRLVSGQNFVLFNSFFRSGKRKYLLECLVFVRELFWKSLEFLIGKNNTFVFLLFFCLVRICENYSSICLWKRKVFAWEYWFGLRIIFENPWSFPLRKIAFLFFYASFIWRGFAKFIRFFACEKKGVCLIYLLLLENYFWKPLEVSTGKKTLSFYYRFFVWQKIAKFIWALAW